MKSHFIETSSGVPKLHEGTLSPGTSEHNVASYPLVPGPTSSLCQHPRSRLRGGVWRRPMSTCPGNFMLGLMHLDADSSVSNGSCTG